MDDDLDRELRVHLEIEAEELRERGLGAEEARAAARRALGNRARIKEEVHDMSRWARLEALGQDARYGLRMLRSHPGSYEGPRCQVPGRFGNRYAHLHCRRRSGPLPRAGTTERPSYRHAAKSAGRHRRALNRSSVSSWRLPVRVAVNSGHDQLLFVPVSEDWSPHNVGAP